MDYAVYIRMLCEYFVKCSFVRDIEIIKVGFLTADELDAVDDLWGRVIQVVCNDNLIARFQEGQSSEGSDISSAAIPYQSAKSMV